MKEKIKNVVAEVGKDPKKTFVVGYFVGSTVMFAAGLIDRAVMKKKADKAIREAMDAGYRFGKFEQRMLNKLKNIKPVNKTEGTNTDNTEEK